MQPGQVVLYELFLLITSPAFLEGTASPLSQPPRGRNWDRGISSLNHSFKKTPSSRNIVYFLRSELQHSISCVQYGILTLAGSLQNVK